MSILPRPDLRKWGSRIDISWWLSGYSIGQVRSFQRPWGAGLRGVTGMNLFHPLALVPPSVPTLPVSTTRNCRHRATCQPPRLPADEARQVCEARPPRPLPTAAATSRITCSSRPQIRAASPGVYSA